MREAEGSPGKLEGLRLERALRGVPGRAPVERGAAAPKAAEAADPVLALVPDRGPHPVFPGGLGRESDTRDPPPAQIAGLEVPGHLGGRRRAPRPAVPRPPSDRPSRRPGSRSLPAAAATRAIESSGRAAVPSVTVTREAAGSPGRFRGPCRRCTGAGRRPHPVSSTTSAPRLGPPAAPSVPQACAWAPHGPGAGGEAKRFGCSELGCRDRRGCPVRRKEAPMREEHGKRAESSLAEREWLLRLDSNQQPSG